MNDWDAFSRMLKQLPVDEKGYYDPSAQTHEELSAECARLRAALEAAERGWEVARNQWLEERAEFEAERDALKKQVEVAREALTRIAEHCVVSDGEFPDDNCDWHCTLTMQSEAKDALARLDQRETERVLPCAECGQPLELGHDCLADQREGQR